MSQKIIIRGILTVSLWLAFVNPGLFAQSLTVRLAVVNTPEDSGLLRDILPDFERQAGLRVEVYSGEDVYDRARKGQADLVISHYGHAALEPFMADGLGLWPRFVFGNQNAIIGPSSDPAHIFGLSDAVEGFRRIAQSKSPFIVNNSGIPKYTTDLLWEAAGRPPKEGWYVDTGLREQQAVTAAAKRGAYTIWGLVPFLESLEKNPVDLRALLVNDALLSRMMVSVVVKPEKFPQANTEGAKALEKYLLLPSTQARIKAFRYPGLDHALWWPSARDNSTAALGYGSEGASSPQSAPSNPGNAADREGGTLPWPTQLFCSPTRMNAGSRPALP